MCAHVDGDDVIQYDDENANETVGNKILYTKDSHLDEDGDDDGDKGV